MQHAISLPNLAHVERLIAVVRLNLNGRRTAKSKERLHASRDLLRLY